MAIVLQTLYAFKEAMHLRSMVKNYISLTLISIIITESLNWETILCMQSCGLCVLWNSCIYRGSVLYYILIVNTAYTVTFLDEIMYYTPIFMYVQWCLFSLFSMFLYSCNFVETTAQMRTVYVQFQINIIIYTKKTIKNCEKLCV